MTPHDLKLGPGGLSDIEWTAQMLQLRFGPKRPRLRTPNTLDALRRLRDDALLRRPIGKRFPRLISPSRVSETVCSCAPASRPRLPHPCRTR